MGQGELIEAGTLVIRSVREADGTHRLALSGEFDIACVPAFAAEMARVEAGDARSIVVDLRELGFIDSSGLRELLAAEQRSQADSHRLVLWRAPDRVHRVFVLSGLEEHLPFADA